MMGEPEQLDLLDWLAAQPPSPPPAAPENTPVVTAQTSDPVLLTRVDPSCNMRRFYSLALATSLFGECGVVRHWGRIGALGQTQTDWYGEASEAKTALQALLRVKRRRGYAS
jgi:predicted DNA-binding WGR domain protein